VPDWQCGGATEPLSQLAVAFYKGDSSRESMIKKARTNRGPWRGRSEMATIWILQPTHTLLQGKHLSADGLSDFPDPRLIVATDMSYSGFVAADGSRFQPPNSQSVCGNNCGTRRTAWSTIFTERLTAGACVGREWLEKHCWKVTWPLLKRS